MAPLLSASQSHLSYYRDDKGGDAIQIMAKAKAGSHSRDKGHASLRLTCFAPLDSDGDDLWGYATEALSWNPAERLHMAEPGCHDSKHWKANDQNGMGCAWVAASHKRRCHDGVTNGEGVSSLDACQVTCRMCHA